jgi:hypothetical protein
MKDYDKSIEELLRAALPDVVVTNFIIVAEVMDESETKLFISMSDNMTPWLANGMLQCGLELLGDSAGYDDEED